MSKSSRLEDIAILGQVGGVQASRNMPTSEGYVVWV